MQQLPNMDPGPTVGTQLTQQPAHQSTALWETPASSQVLAPLPLSLAQNIDQGVANMADSTDQETFAPFTSTSTLTYKYDVFVSFRGETRNSFTDHLIDALERKRIRVYKDDKNLPRGEIIWTELMKAIEASRIAIVVFSKNYATSRWCLDELVKIMDCQRKLNQWVLPIFYDVSPSEVRDQKGNFAEALPNGPEVMVNSWKATLRDVANLSGLHLKSSRGETDFIKETVEIILKNLRRESATDPWQIDVPPSSSAIVLHNIPLSNNSEWASKFCEHLKQFFIWYLVLGVIVPLIIFVAIFVNIKKDFDNAFPNPPSPPSGPFP